MSEQDRTVRNFLAEIFLTGLSEKETKLRHDHQAVEDLHHPPLAAAASGGEMEISVTGKAPLLPTFLQLPRQTARLGWGG